MATLKEKLNIEREKIEKELAYLQPEFSPEIPPRVRVRQKTFLLGKLEYAE
ncbi:MAG: hypothetical protein KJ888_20710 [Gammaproteobacteria bacterium]|nr:hypothetical protein [Gammaproteobacteria bacterium]